MSEPAFRCTCPAPELGHYDAKCPFVGVPHAGPTKPSRPCWCHAVEEKPHEFEVTNSVLGAEHCGWLPTSEAAWRANPLVEEGEGCGCYVGLAHTNDCKAARAATKKLVKALAAMLWEERYLRDHIIAEADWKRLVEGAGLKALKEDA